VSPTCTHLDQIELTELPEAIPGCEDCLAIGGSWLHEPGEDWSWCYVDQVAFVIGAPDAA
jgi:hypothetical protein